jgi:ABC-type uncharacterized transport system permease subunit
MTPVERIVLLGFFAAVLALLASSRPLSALLGGLAGAAAGVVLAGRVRRLSKRMDERLGSDPVQVRGIRPRSLALRAGAHLAGLGLLLLGVGLVPFVGDELFVALAAGATTLPAVLTAWRLRH